MTSFQGKSEKRQPRGSIWDGPFAWKYQKDNDEIEELIKLLFFLVAGRKE